MIDLLQTLDPSPDLHRVSADPGIAWSGSASVAIDAPPDDAADNSPDATWSTDAVRTGRCGAVTPRVVRLPDATYRMYYTQILPRAGHPEGALDYGNATTRILSARSEDGWTWTPEPGVRLSAAEGGAGSFRVVVTDVVPVTDGRLRMYYECAPGPQSEPSTIRSAVSEDGMTWTVEQGDRFGGSESNFASARVTFLDDGRLRLYLLERGTGIISAISEDGSAFGREPGVRIDQSGPYDGTVAFAPEVVILPSGERAMYYAGYASASRAFILHATSPDGLTWHKADDPVLTPGGRWDGAKCSEMCLFPLREGIDEYRYGMAYEACDGSARDERGVWRILNAQPAS
tara:strand:+ start:32 stop:1066 length:1035 start_codon:yes stop_codon:yes gene_type:complete